MNPAVQAGVTDRPVRRWAATLARLVLGAVWLAAGLAKVGDLDESVRAVRAYRLLPEVLAQVVGAALPLAEAVDAAS